MAKSPRLSNISIVVSITMVLFVLGLFGLLLINTQRLTDNLQENVLVILYLERNIDDASVEKLTEEILSLPFVKKASYVSKEEAAFEYKELLEKDFVEILGDNPLPASIEVFLHARSDLKAEEAALKTLGGLKGVEEVDYERDLLGKIDRNKRVVGNILIALALLMVLISLVLVNNAIRLSVYAQRFLVKSMQLVGATEWFIIRPFVMRSLVHVLVAAVAAFGLTLLSYFTIGLWIQNNLLGSGMELFSVNIFMEDIRIYSLLFASLIILGVMIVVPGTYFATQKYLRLKVDDLY